MDNKQIYRALKAIIAGAGRTRQILRYGLLENGWLRVTDLDHELTVRLDSAGTQRVLVDIALFVKTGDLDAAITSAQYMDIEEFPARIDAEAGRLQPVGILNGLNDLLPAVSKDTSREALQCVFVDHKRKEAVATDGHLLLLKKVDHVGLDSFLIDSVSLKIAAMMTPTGLSVRHRKAMEDADGEVTTPAADFVTIAGSDWQLISRVPDSYPQYWKVIPERARSKAVAWDSDLKAQVLSFLDKSIPLANTKSHMVMFTNNEGIVKNSDISCFRKTDFPKEVFGLKPDQLLGLNGDRLRNVLKFIGNRPASVTVGEEMIQCVLWQGDGFTVLLMPLRTYYETRSALMQDMAEIAHTSSNTGDTPC